MFSGKCGTTHSQSPLQHTHTNGGIFLFARPEYLVTLASVYPKAYPLEILVDLPSKYYTVWAILTNTKHTKRVFIRKQNCVKTLVNVKLHFSMGVLYQLKN